MNRQYIQIEIGNLARVCSQNAQGSGHHTPTPPLGASDGITFSLASQMLTGESHASHMHCQQSCYVLALLW